MKRLCYKCFSELPENANYCPNCGEAMREQETKTKDERDKAVEEWNKRIQKKKSEEE